MSVLVLVWTVGKTGSCSVELKQAFSGGGIDEMREVRRNVSFFSVAFCMTKAMYISMFVVYCSVLGYCRGSFVCLANQ